MMKFFLLLALAAPVAQSQGNAMKKIVGLLQDMKATVEKEGVESKKHWEEYSENFRSQKQGTEYSIQDATDDLEAAKACVADSAAKAQEAEGSIANLGSKIAEDQDALAGAIKVREEENADFQKSEADLTETVDMLVRAASIIRKATGGAGSSGSAAKLKAALTQVAGGLQVLLQAAYINGDSKAQLQALMQEGQKADDDDDDEPASAGYSQPTAAAYESKSGNIVDLLADLKQQAEGELSDLRKDEMKKQQAFEMTKQSLTDAIATAERDLANSKTRLAEEQQVNAECSGESDAQAKKLKENQDLLAEIVQMNEEKTTEYEASTKDRDGELGALSKAIEILTAKEFSGATERRDVFLQETPDVRSEVADVLKKAANRFSNVLFAQLAQSAMDDPFAKVKGLIKEMVDRLQKQAAEEADHKAYCDKENKKSKAKRDDLSSKLEKYSSRHEKAQADTAQLKEDLANIASEQARMDEENAAAKKLRDEQSSSYNSLMEDCRVGLDGIAKAIEVLKEYYSQTARSSDSGNNVVAFLEVAQEDMIKMKTDGEEEEHSAVAQFEKLSNEYEVMSASNKATVEAKESESARLASAVSDLKNDIDGTSTELNATLEYIEKLKEACVHKVMSFEERAAKMQQEIDSLEQALEILENETAGGESFLQRK